MKSTTSTTPDLEDLDRQYAEEAATSGASKPTGNGEAKAATPPVIVPTKKFVTGFVPPQYEIDGLLRRGCLYSLTAPTGHGKTAVALYLEVLLSTGSPLAGRAVEQGTGIYFAAENPEDVKCRMILMADRMQLDLVTLPLHFVEGGFNINDWSDHIRGQVEAIGGCSSVTIDTGPAFQAACGFADENDNMSALRFALLLRSFTKLPGNPVVLVPTHPIKNATRDNLLPRGGSAFLNEVDGNLTLWAEGERETTELHWAGKLRGPAFDPITFALDKGTCAPLVDAKGRRIPSVWAYQATAERAERAASRNRDDEDAMLITLLNAPVGSIATWAKSLEWLTPNGEPSKSRVQRAIERLHAGKLVAKKRDRWTLTKGGKAEAERLVEQAQ
jgi:AAA domain